MAIFKTGILKVRDLTKLVIYKNWMSESKGPHPPNFSRSGTVMGLSNGFGSIAGIIVPPVKVLHLKIDQNNLCFTIVVTKNATAQFSNVIQLRRLWLGAPALVKTSLTGKKTSQTQLLEIGNV